MNKKLKDESLKFLIKSQNKDGNIENILDIKELYETSISFSKNKLFLEAKKTIDYGLKNQKNSDYIYFTLAITSYLNNLTTNKELGYNNNFKKEVKNYIRAIKKSLYYFEEHFNEELLLIYRKDNNQKQYFAIDNAILLFFADEISQILNHFGFNREADKFFMFKGKIELGFQRYLFYNKDDIILSKFVESGEYTIANNKELNEIFSYYIVDEKFYKKYFNKYSLKEKIEINDVEEDLLILLNLKKINKKIYENNIKLINKYLIKYPQFIKKKIDYEKEIKISKSINKEYVGNNFEIKAENKILININSIKIVNLILKIFKDE